MFSYIQTHIQLYFQNGIKANPLLIMIIVWISIQLLKIIIDAIRCKQFHLSSLFAAWWFPSFHAGIVSSITTMVLIQFGFDSIFFALACGFSILVAYDAMNIRFESGKQAQHINEIRTSITSVLSMNKKISPLLKERLGHTPFEVFGGLIIGVILTFVLYYYLILI